MFKLKKERINFKKKIGSGASGTVYPYQKDADDLKWVVKRMHADDSDKLLSYLPEIVLGFSCDHPCIVPLKGYSIEKGDQEDYYIFLKFPRMKETLKDKFDQQKKSNKPFSEQEIVRYFYSMVCAVDYLHKKKIYHRDIKPGNVLLDENGNALLSDVGVAKHVGDEEIYQPLTGQGGTVDYTAPELLKDKFKLTKENLIAGDGWSLGLVMLELCVLKNRLWSPYSVQEKIEEVQKSLYDKLKEIYSKTLLELIFKLLKFEPNERIEIADLKQKLEAEYQDCVNSKVDLINENVDSLESINNAQEELKLRIESLKQENFQLQNDLKEYKSFIRQLQSEIFPGLDMSSDNDILQKLLTNYQDSLKKLKEGERTIINQPEDEEEKKESQDSIPGSQTLVPIGTMIHENQLPSQRAIGLERLDRVKVILAGSTACGKSNIASSLTSKPFNEAYSATIGASYSQLTLNQDETTLTMRIWDTSGQEKYKEMMMDIFFKGSPVVIIVYDITVRKSFENIPEWIELKSRHVGGPKILFIVGTKLDRGNERKVPKEEAEEFTRQQGGIYVEVSAKTGENIDELKEKIASTILENFNSTSLPTSTVRVTEQRKSTFWGIFG